MLMFTGCASGQITLIKQKEARLDSSSDFFIIENEKSEKVTYNVLITPLIELIQ